MIEAILIIGLVALVLYIALRPMDYDYYDDDEE